MKGSMAANLFQEKCTDGGWNSIIKDPLTFLGVCPPTEGPKSLLHQATVNQNQANNFAAAQRVAGQFVKRAACGVDSYGLNTLFSVMYDTVGHWAKHNGANDGVVDFDSCAAGLNQGAFGTSYTNGFYKASLNHGDLTFRNADGWWGDDRKPIKWFECTL
ncbi:Aste57867_4107 [Aphanomyces stellatus]|uniref:Aste57867_4107 protein n=1 Tax=Aphanomyces stellatus TaxID=120398 RepID=A0A485KAY6_9STRA|nr:hypothetical protein As57867_004096 [Aphanomyces stellatus]VFT81238.1 Aste57867_4107 [Aphanomyces stellatus]